MQLSRTFGGGFRGVTAIVSTTAAVLSILGMLRSWGFFGMGDLQPAVANMGARWIGIAPSIDTAHAVNDTVHFAATVTDRNGATLAGVRPTWTVDDPTVASVLQDGSVIARGAGTTTVIAVIGEFAARAHVVVRQTVRSVRIAGDSAITMAEGDARALEARAFDPRGYLVADRAAVWRAASGTAAAVDSAGHVTAADVGSAVLSATVDGVTAQTVVRVLPSPSAIALVRGDSQRAPYGATLPSPVIVRVMDRHARPVAGTMVRFATVSGVADPSVVVTDADGRARTTWGLGGNPGRQHLVASVEGVDSTAVLTADALPVPANTRVVVLSDTLSAAVGQVVASRVAVRVTDSTGRPLADVAVAWSADAGGTIVANADRTDSAGESRATWRLGPTAGMQRARARVPGIQPVALAATASAGPPVRVALERVGAADPLAHVLAVRAVVRDSFGNVVPHASVKLAARSGTVSPAVGESDSSGRVTAAWTLAMKSGDQRLVAVLARGRASDSVFARAALSPQRLRQAGRPRP